MLFLLCSAHVQAEGFSDLPDPTQPEKPRIEHPVSKLQPSLHKLHSIIFSSKRRVAVINGKVVREGQHVDGAQVLKISPDQVWLQLADNSHRTLSLERLADISVSKSFRPGIAAGADVTDKSETIVE